MKTKIIPVKRVSHYALEELMVSADLTEDNQLVRIVGRGFVPYMIWVLEERPALKSLFLTTEKDVTPTKEEIFKSYLDAMFQVADIPGGSIYRPTDDELKSEFKLIHANKELEEFATLPDGLKKEYGEIFKEYMSWLSYMMEQAEAKRELSRRAQAIYILLLEENGKGCYKYSKSRVEKFACDKWLLTKSQPYSVYEAYRKIKNERLDIIKLNFSHDYELALEQYLKDFPC